MAYSALPEPRRHTEDHRCAVVGAVIAQGFTHLGLEVRTQPNVPAQPNATRCLTTAWRPARVRRRLTRGGDLNRASNEGLRCACCANWEGLAYRLPKLRAVPLEFPGQTARAASSMDFPAIRRSPLDFRLLSHVFARKSSGFLPEARAALNQSGRLPIPPQVLP